MKNNPYIYRVDEVGRVWFIKDIAKVIALLLIIFFSAYPSYATQIGLSGLITDDVTEPEDTTEVVVKDLDEFTVSAKLYERKGARESFVFSSEDLKKSLNVGELLGKLPMLRYSAMSEDIEYMGSKKIVYLVDSIPREKEEVVGLMRTNPKQFYKVDVIPNPGGLYMAYDLLINLHRQKTYTGIDITIGDRTEVTPTNYLGKGNHFKLQNEFLYLSYIKNKIDFNAQLTGFWGRGASSYSATREFPLMNIVREWEQSPRDDPYNTNIIRNYTLIARLGYSFNDNHRISIVAQDFIRLPDNFGREVFTQRSIHGSGDIERYNRELISSSRDRQPLGAALFANYIGRVNAWTLQTYVIGQFINNKVEAKYKYLPGDLYETNQNTNSSLVGVNVSANRSFLNDRMALTLGGIYNYTFLDTRDMETDVIVSKNRFGWAQFNGNVDCQLTNSLFFSLFAGINIDYYSNFDYSRTNIDPVMMLKFGWTPSRNFNIIADYCVGVQEPDDELFVERLVTGGDLIMNNGNPRLKPTIGQFVDLTLRLFGDFSLGFKYYNCKNEILTTARQVSREDSPTGHPFVMLYPDNENIDGFITRLMYGKTFFNHLEIWAGFYITYRHARYKDISKSRWNPFARFDIGYVGMNNTFQAKLYYSYGDDGQFTALTTGRSHTDSMRLYVSKRMLKKRNLNIFVQYTLPVHFGDNSNTVEMVTDVYRYKMNMDNYFRSDNSIMIGIDYYFHKGEKVKQFNDPMKSL